MYDDWLFKTELVDRHGMVHEVDLFRNKAAAKAFRNLRAYPVTFTMYVRRGPGHLRGETGLVRHTVTTTLDPPLASVDAVPGRKIVTEQEQVVDWQVARTTRSSTQWNTL